jgi:LuxR family quorum sensing-dependent transcriptional regulator
LSLQDTIAAVESCSTMTELCDALQRVAGNYGFAAFTFIDAGQPHLDRPYYVTTTGPAWVAEYTDNGFVHVDPCLIRVRRTNTPFAWGSIELPPSTGRHRPGAVQTMEAARDHGFTEGFVVPFHFRDRLGCTFSSSTVFFWKDTQQRFRHLLETHRNELHLTVLCWVQRAVDVVAAEHRQRPPFLRPPEEGVAGLLTERERAVIAWAARGKTGAETADILKLSDETVATYMRTAQRKLGAANKTHAVAKAIVLGVIEP